MGIWIELGIFGLALAFGLWQIHDVKKAREATRRQRAAQAAQAAQRPTGRSGDSPPPDGNEVQTLSERR